MKAIDLKKDLNKYLFDKERHISNEQMKNVCLIANGESTCKYIMMFEKNGFVCAKKTPMSEVLDDLANKNQITAKSDNCEGLGSYEKKKKEETGTKNNTKD